MRTRGDCQPADETCDGRPATIRAFGRGGRDVLQGGRFADLLDGGAGRDRLSGRGGRDRCLDGEVLGSCEVRD